MARPKTGRKRPPGEVWMLVKDRKLMARLMAIQGYTQRALAKDAGFATHSYLGRMINGTATSCTAERAVAIAACLQVPVDSLFSSNVSSDGTRVRQPQDTRSFHREAASSAGSGGNAAATAAAGRTKPGSTSTRDQVSA